MDDVYLRLQFFAYQLKTWKPHNVDDCCAQNGHRAGASAPVAAGILMQLSETEPEPSLYIPASQLQQNFRGGSQTGNGKVGGLK